MFESYLNKMKRNKSKEIEIEATERISINDLNRLRIVDISILMLCKFKPINQLLFPLKSSGNHRFFNSFSDDFKGNGRLIPLNFAKYEKKI